MPVLLLIVAAILPRPCAAAEARPQSGTHLIPRTPSRVHSAPKSQFAQTYQLGDVITIPAFSFEIIGGRYQTTLTCQLVGEHCYLFVENEIWNIRVAAPDLQPLAQAFDQTTARDPNRGIYAIETNLFGEPPNVDGDPRVIIAIIDILDSPIQGFTIVGYFDVENQAPPISREIIYLDARPLDINSGLARATLAHEFQHMLHWDADPDEAKWLDEGASEYAELACGYKDTTAAEMASFLSLAANTDLTEWEDQSWDFDQAFLWMTFFVQSYGESALRLLIADRDNGIQSVNNTLEALDKPERFDHLFGQWAAAVYSNGYNAIDLGPTKSDTLAVPAANLGRVASLWGVDYLALGNTSNLSLTLAPNGDNDILLTLMHIDSAQPLSAPLVIATGQTRRIHTYGSANRALALSTTSGTARGYTLSVAPLGDGLTPSASDFDDSGEVGFSDFLVFANGFGKRAGDVGFDPTFDLSNDRQVAFADFLIFVKNFGAKP